MLNKPVAHAMHAPTAWKQYGSGTVLMMAEALKTVSTW